MSNYREKIHELWEQLMSNEMVIAEQLEEVCKEFERNIRDMLGYFLENCQVIRNLNSFCPTGFPSAVNVVYAMQGKPIMTQVTALHITNELHVHYEGNRQLCDTTFNFVEHKTVVGKFLVSRRIASLLLTKTE